MNVLAIGAHPDDIEVFCAGTLLKYKQQGHDIFIALTTSGNIGSNEYESREAIAQAREEEQLEAAKVMGAQVRFMRFDDQGLQDTPETRRAVINAIRWANPDVILTNYPLDPSTDHAITGKIVSEVMLSIPGKLIPADEPPISKNPSLFYFGTAVGIDFMPEVYVDITDFYEQKKEALSKHTSQYAWMDVYQTHGLLDIMEITDKFRGLQAGFVYAEAYRAFRIHGYMPNYKLLP
ncbi:PIG-L deacetylase family protein [Paenibacillus sp. CF384]|uniref:PIG-L deacetylase family protein n=1 Tax=Paenibacillus sp. CF384 TaxID=1884382 RepID=UPI00089B5132|nr:PIG-L deacetylase family protein [Paenibacillus sp. CF384]SDW06065.1 N-acetylglucosaminyl deacetylase, LmbE family [Paenibacillus sp. CF384]